MIPRISVDVVLFMLLYTIGYGKARDKEEGNKKV
tara:strand:+ start:128 stop:229 length:102 start_codon:yes stop_codon:yes gene_type:complete